MRPIPADVLPNATENLSLEIYRRRRHPSGSGAPPSGVDSSLQTAKNRSAGSLRVGAYRYTRILRVSKLLWEYNVLEVSKFIRPYQNLRKSLLILKSLKKYLKLRFLITQKSPVIHSLQERKKSKGCDSA